MANCDPSFLQDAGTFTENLSEELAQLDEANIHTMIGAETQIHELMQELDRALVEIGQMETKLRSQPQSSILFNRALDQFQSSFPAVCMMSCWAV